MSAISLAKSAVGCWTIITTAILLIGSDQDIVPAAHPVPNEPVPLLKIGLFESRVMSTA